MTTVYPTVYTSYLSPPILPQCTPPYITTAYTTVYTTSYLSPSVLPLCTTTIYHCRPTQQSYTVVYTVQCIHHCVVPLCTTVYHQCIHPIAIATHITSTKALEILWVSIVLLFIVVILSHPMSSLVVWNHL